MNLFASLDLGSNSCRLVIAKKHPATGQLMAVDELKESVRLAEGLVHNDDYITDIAKSRTLKCLKRFGELLVGIPLENIRAVATNTVRVAKNQTEFLKEASAVLGVPLEVISGKEEARLIFLGVLHQLSMQEQQEKKLIIDIGGGSTEMILGTQIPAILESLSLGCVTYSQKFFSNIDEPITKKQYEHAYNTVLEVFEPFLSLYRNDDHDGNNCNLQNTKWDKVYASSGTAKAVAQFLFANQLCPFETITIAGLHNLKKMMFAAKNPKELLHLKGMKEDRLPVLAGGVVILEGLMNSLNITSLFIGHGALRWGVLVELTDIQKHHDVQQKTIDYWINQAHLDTQQIQRVLCSCQYLWELVHHQVDNKNQKKMIVTPFPELLKYAIYLHEWGMMISHDNAFLHTSYLLSHVDLEGFSKAEQHLLAQLTLLQHHKINYKTSKKNTQKQIRQEQINDAFEYLWANKDHYLWLRILRLSIILCRSRMDIPWYEHCHYNNSTQQFIFDADFLTQYPLTAYQLESELSISNKQYKS